MSESDVDAEPILICLSLAPWVTRLPIDSLRVAFGLGISDSFLMGLKSPYELRFFTRGTDVGPPQVVSLDDFEWSFGCKY